MPTIAVSSVIVNRDRRIRREVKAESIEGIAESLQRLGRLIHPIVLNEFNELVAGETRLEAHKLLGWDRIEYKLWDDLDEVTHLSIELEENIKRSDLPWQDQVDALHRLHQLKVAEEPDWTTNKTATLIGMSQQHVSDMLNVAKEVASGNTRVVEAKQFSVAKNVTRRATERRRESEVATLLSAEEAPAPTSPILCEDFLEWVITYSGQPFNFIHCDFPYGINADKFNQGAADEFGGYEDTPETYWRLVACLCDNKEKLLGESGHVLFWFSMRYYTETLAVLREHFWVDPYPLVWVKSDNKGTLPDPSRGPRRIYEVAFLCSFGDRKIISAVSNVASFPTVRVGEHMSEKSEDMLAHFFRMTVDETTRMLDPTCGSGSALRAAFALGAASVLGLEKNEEFASNARRAWEKRDVRG